MGTIDLILFVRLLFSYIECYDFVTRIVRHISLIPIKCNHFEDLFNFWNFPIDALLYSNIRVTFLDDVTRVLLLLFHPWPVMRIQGTTTAAAAGIPISNTVKEFVNLLFPSTHHSPNWIYDELCGPEDNR